MQFAREKIMIGMRLNIIGISPTRIKALTDLFRSSHVLHGSIKRCNVVGMDENETTKWFGDAPRLPLAKLEKCDLVKKYGTFTAEIHVWADCEIDDIDWGNNAPVKKEKWCVKTGSEMIDRIHLTLGIFPKTAGYAQTLPVNDQGE
jgi:hypothetical protein